MPPKRGRKRKGEEVGKNAVKGSEIKSRKEEKPEKERSGCGDGFSVYIEHCKS